MCRHCEEDERAKKAWGSLEIAKPAEDIANVIRAAKELIRHRDVQAGGRAQRPEVNDLRNAIDEYERGAGDR